MGYLRVWTAQLQTALRNASPTAIGRTVLLSLSRGTKAKAETIREKPFFRGAYRHHRCIIPANGFYEWQGSKGNKQAFYLYPADSDFFGFAGLWETWERPDEVIESFTIITTEANAIMAPIHERMPVILNHQDYAEWLHDGEYSLLKPFDAEGMRCHTVSKKVNSPTHDGPELISKI